MGRLWLVLLIASTLTGCDRGPTYVPVTGTVKYSDGTPPTGAIATVTFQPTASASGTKAASGTINPDGSFTLSTLKPNDGALPGEYRVTVYVIESYPGGKALVAERFTKSDATPLTATVTEDGENHFDLVVERP